jgi:hypothetical protein
MTPQKFTVYSTGGGYAVAPEMGEQLPFFLLQSYIRRYYRARVNGRKMNLDQQKARAERYAEKLNGQAKRPPRGTTEKDDAMPTESKHTPGPWTISKAGDVVSADGRRVAEPVWALKTTQAEGEANAHLIASAPELLEALKRLEGACCGNLNEDDAWKAWIDARNAARAAIAKAEGR